MELAIDFYRFCIIGDFFNDPRGNRMVRSLSENDMSQEEGYLERLHSDSLGREWLHIGDRERTSMYQIPSLSATSSQYFLLAQAFFFHNFSNELNSSRAVLTLKERQVVRADSAAVLSSIRIDLFNIVICWSWDGRREGHNSCSLKSSFINTLFCSVTSGTQLYIYNLLGSHTFKAIGRHLSKTSPCYKFVLDHKSSYCGLS